VNSSSSTCSAASLHIRSTATQFFCLHAVPKSSSFSSAKTNGMTREVTDDTDRSSSCCARARNFFLPQNHSWLLSAATKGTESSTPIASTHRAEALMYARQFEGCEKQKRNWVKITSTGSSSERRKKLFSLPHSTFQAPRPIMCARLKHKKVYFSFKLLLTGAMGAKR
jgi:hypothetical protein